MRYIMLIYSEGTPTGPSPAEEQKMKEAHWALISETTRRGILLAAEPLGPSATATTVRAHQGKAVMTDGPFAETKEQLAGFYILECKDLDEALEWAARIPTGCRGGVGCIEVRPLPGLPSREQDTQVSTVTHG